MLGINDRARINYTESVLRCRRSGVLIMLVPTLVARRLLLQMHQKLISMLISQGRKTYLMWIRLRKQTGELFTRLHHHPAPLPNEERSGALGPRKGNLAGWRLLGSRAEVPPAPHDPSVISLSFPLQEHGVINLSPFHRLIT